MLTPVFFSEALFATAGRGHHHGPRVGEISRVMPGLFQWGHGRQRRPLFFARGVVERERRGGIDTERRRIPDWKGGAGNAATAVEANGDYYYYYYCAMYSRSRLL